MTNTKKKGAAEPENKPKEMHPMAQQVIFDVSETLVSMSRQQWDISGLQMVIDQWVLSGMMQSDNELHRDTYFYLRQLSDAISNIRQHDLPRHMPLLHKKLFYI
jgi:hypothetical protein